MPAGPSISFTLVWHHFRTPGASIAIPGHELCHGVRMHCVIDQPFLCASSILQAYAHGHEQFLESVMLMESARPIDPGDHCITLECLHVTIVDLTHRFFCLLALPPPMVLSWATCHAGWQEVDATICARESGCFNSHTSLPCCHSGAPPLLNQALTGLHNPQDFMAKKSGRSIPDIKCWRGVQSMSLG